MFHRYGKKINSLHAKPLKDLTRIISATSLLAEEKRKGLVKQIEEHTSLEAERYESLCTTVLYNFVNHCQHLPDSSNNYYSQAGGMIDYALNRTEAALNLFKNYLSLDEKTGLSEEQKLWQYALFTAALLQGIGKLHIDLTVQIYDNNGQHLKQWNPLLESLVQVGANYTYSFEKEGDLDFRRRLNILIARFLMPASGYAWIVSNPQVLAVWLALLNEEPYASGTLGAILIRANAIALQRYLLQMNVKASGNRASRYHRAGTFTGTVPGQQDDMQIGILFIQWLTKSLQSGILMVNKAPLLSVPGGILLCPEIFKLFMLEHPEFKNWQAVQKGFRSLNLHKTSPNGETTFRYEQQNNQQMHNGILCTEYAIFIPEAVQFYNLNTGKSFPLSAVELIHHKQANSDFTLKESFMAKNPLSSLNQDGKWEPIVSSPSSDNTLKIT